MLGRKTGGRQKGSLNKATADIKAIAQKYTPQAIDTLVSIMAESDSDAAKVAAAKELLDRGHGKSHQTTDVAITDRSMVQAPPPIEETDEWADRYGKPH